MKLAGLSAILFAVSICTTPVFPQLSGQAPPTLVRVGEHRIPFQARDGLIYIEAQVNGMHTNLLVDTGAAMTTFDLKIVPTLNAESRITVNIAKGSMLAYRLPVGFTLGDSSQPERKCLFRQNVVVGDFKFMSAHGVVGIDVLGSFKSATFDFLNSVLVLVDR
jgi:hypothetical protein